jgi:gliding motility-associated-like protein
VSVISGAKVTVTDASAFSKRDTVLLIQMTGVTSDGNEVYMAGKYEFHIISSITGNNITLVIPPQFDPASELVQLIRVPTYKNAEVTNMLTCQPWNYSVGTGGVAAIIVDQTLTLNADIDVSAKGFAGGQATSDPVTVNCPIILPPPDDDYPATFLNAGNKGEGNVQKAHMTSNPKGKGAAWSGGGGGNGFFAGGSGGANGGDGGNGGNSVCGNSPLVADKGGSRAWHEYPEWLNRIFMGGGGGTGNGAATNGGAGGGIAFVVAKNLVFNNTAAIKANGESVSGSPDAGGAGGGGAGGSIMIVTDHFNRLTVEAKGGNGGNTSETGAYSVVGVGGGGGGGMLYTNLDLSTVTNNDNVSIIVDKGDMGIVLPYAVSTSASPGTPGTILPQQTLQQRGFLFNFLTVGDTVLCHKDRKYLKASMPQGGKNDQYQYGWQSRKGANGIWESTATASNTQHFLTDPFLTADTVFFRRIVTTTQLINSVETLVSDTSLAVKVVVLPSFLNNAILTKDTILCGDVAELDLHAAPVSGGFGVPVYRWERKGEENAWSDAQNDQMEITAPLQTGNNYYRRIVMTPVSAPAACSDTSASVSLRLLSQISNNELNPPQYLCETDPPAWLKSAPLAGGDGDYAYFWETSADNTNWTSLPFTTDSCRPAPAESRYYRRTAISGKWGCCRHTSPAAEVRFDKSPSDAEILYDRDTLNFLFKIDLQALNITVGKGEWTAVDGDMSFSSPNRRRTEVSGLKLGANTIRWTVSNGVCPTKTAETTIFVKDITIPNGFSPNNDSYNDCFGILGIENAEKFELIIINRANKSVFRTSGITGNYPYPCLWEGKDDAGNELPAGTYYFRLKMNDNQIRKGYVILRK